jgi:hypothetical protein
MSENDSAAAVAQRPGSGVRDRRSVRITVDELAAVVTAGALAFIKRGQKHPKAIADDVLDAIAHDILSESVSLEGRSIDALTDSFHRDNSAPDAWQNFVARLVGDRVQP